MTTAEGSVARAVVRPPRPRRWRRWARWAMDVAVVAVGVAFVLHQLGSTDRYACTTIDSGDTLSVALPEGVHLRLAAVRVTLCQDDLCRSTTLRRTTFSVLAPTADGEAPATTGPDVDHLLWHEPPYSFDLTEDGGDLGADWAWDATTTVQVRGTSSDGKRFLDHRETFTFDEHYPNGRGCEPGPMKRHQTEIPLSAISPA